MVGGSQWEVGDRYSLIKLLGEGSYGEVCLAEDHQLGEKVALKKIPHVLKSHENAKRVLREICVLRRIYHPNIISLLDVFVRSSSTGPFRMIRGKLQSASLDVYISTEFAEGGDLYGLRGQLTEGEVAQLMAQLLETVNFLHSIKIIHRDLKTANILLANHSRIIKICDFGLARIIPGEREGSQDGSEYSDVEPPQTPEHHSASGTGYVHEGLPAHLTGKVCTPCYRAPEVTMGQDTGHYSTAMDLWSCGCIFGELLQRQHISAGSIAPRLQVNPLFQLSGEVRTPSLTQDLYTSKADLSKRVHRELKAIFDVIGNPSWADIRAITGRNWRHYLHKLPGTPSSLYRRFHSCGEEAVDLLQRMLMFNPERRCTAMEALSHVFFDSFKALREAIQPSAHPRRLSYTEAQQVPMKRKWSEKELTKDLTDEMAEQCHVADPEAKREMFWEVADPTLAMQLLEEELDQIANEDASSHDDHLRTFLEQECASHRWWVQQNPDVIRKVRAAERLMVMEHGGLFPTIAPAEDMSEDDPEPFPTGPSFWSFFHDQPPVEQSCLFEQDRLPKVTEGTLDPECHLRKSRHGDWPTSTAHDLPCTSGADVWGVSTVPSTVLQSKKVRFDGGSEGSLEQYSSLSSKQAGR